MAFRHTILRVEHGTGGTLEELAADMLSLSYQLDCPVVCKVNEQRFDMHAIRGAMTARQVVADWRRANGIEPPPSEGGAP